MLLLLFVDSATGVKAFTFTIHACVSSCIVITYIFIFSLVVVRTYIHYMLRIWCHSVRLDSQLFMNHLYSTLFDDSDHQNHDINDITMHINNQMYGSMDLDSLSKYYDLTDYKLISSEKYNLHFFILIQDPYQKI